MYGGGSQLDPRDSIADTTPLSIIEAQKEIEEADITPDEDEDQPKPLDMTEEEVEAVSVICSIFGRISIKNCWSTSRSFLI